MSTTATAIATAAATPPCRPFAHATRGRRATHGCTRCRAFARSRREAGAAVARGLGAGCPLAGRRLPSRRPDRRWRRGGWPPPWALTPPPRRRRLSAGQRHGDSHGGPRVSAPTQGHEEAAATATARAGRRRAGESNTTARKTTSSASRRAPDLLPADAKATGTGDETGDEGGRRGGRSKPVSHSCTGDSERNPRFRHPEGGWEVVGGAAASHALQEWWKGPLQYPQPPFERAEKSARPPWDGAAAPAGNGDRHRPGDGGWRTRQANTTASAHLSDGETLVTRDTRVESWHPSLLLREVVLLPAPLLRARLVIEISGYPIVHVPLSIRHGDACTRGHSW